MHSPEDYRRLFATHEEVIVKAIGEGDVDTLYWCFENQSWTSGGPLKIPDFHPGQEARKNAN
jgi:hypothetical protein